MNAPELSVRFLAPCLSVLALASACQGPSGNSAFSNGPRTRLGVPQPASAALAQPAAVPNKPRRRKADFHAREGGLVRVGGHLWNIAGDYDGNTLVVSDPSDSVIVPDYDPTFAPEVGFGYRGKRYGWDLTYKRFESEGEFGGGVADDQWNYVDLDFKQFYRLDKRLQPYVSLGAGYFFGTVTDGASDGVNFEDSDFSGASLNIGAGLALYLSERLAIDVRGIYRFAKTLEVETVSFGDLGIDDGLSADGYGVSVGLSYTIN